MMLMMMMLMIMLKRMTMSIQSSLIISKKSMCQIELVTISFSGNICVRNTSYEQ